MTHGAINYHGALAPLGDACDIAEADILYVQDLLQAATTKESLKRKASIALRHLRFVGSMFCNRKRKLIVVRDFSNIPLAVVFPLVQRMANRMLFVVNHNLQWAMGSRTERAAFRWLGRMGCRFAFFEQVPESILNSYGIDPEHCVALPHPVPETAFKRHRFGGVETIGVIGQFRPEKGMDELLEQLLPLASRYRIKLALPNLEDFRRSSTFANIEGLALVDTSTSDQYLKAIADCDVVVLSHPSAGYEYRASGLIADAAAAHVPIVVRNLPVLSRQTTQPKRIGECFDQLADVPDCLDQVSSRLAAGAYDFASYNRKRTAQELAGQLDGICRTI